jgi:peptidoglycan hydrolase CwlO-like protein
MNFDKFPKISFKKFLIAVLILTFLLPHLLVLGEMDPVEERQALEEELRELEEKIAQYEEDITKTQQEKKTLQNQIYILRKEIEKLDLQIYQSSLTIKDLGYQIEETEDSINKTSLKIEDSRNNLANTLQLIYEEDQKSLIEILLSEGELSDFFDNLVALENLNSKIQELLRGIKDLRVYLEGQKQSLDEEKTDLEGLVQIKTLQRQESQTIQREKDYFLELTEAEYQEYLKEKEVAEKRAAEIRTRIFELIGVPEAPTFGEALDIAKYVEGITGVRPAFLLAVLTQESNIGKNVGQCYLKDPDSGDGVIAYNGKEVSKVMNPSRDVPLFLEITKELGRDPYNTPVSCPMSYGWGGAMGPAQFIPSTWMIYKEKVKEITGRPADPWNIKDAFLAAALYLADYGAYKQTYDAEWRAAMIYFSGTTKKTRYNGYGFYGDSVMKIASNYQADIEAIEKAD